jgi:hypothetical protein
VFWHEDLPRHFYLLLDILGLQFRWVLTRIGRGRTLVPAADRVVDDQKEHAWMALYANDRDVLETLLYRRLKTLWDDCTDALAIFSKHRAGTELCGQKVWEALLTAFPLNHKRMKTVLLAKEFSSLMAWDGQPTVSSRLGRFSRTPTLIPTTCTTHSPFELFSRPPSLTCLRFVDGKW